MLKLKFYIEIELQIKLLLSTFDIKKRGNPYT